MFAIVHEITVTPASLGYPLSVDLPCLYPVFNRKLYSQTNKILSCELLHIEQTDYVQGRGSDDAMGWLRLVGSFKL